MKLQPRSLAHIKTYWTAYTVLIASLSLTFAAYLGHKRYVSTREHARFAQGAQLIFKKVEAQLNILLTVMKGVRGLYAASEDVSAVELRKYFQLLTVRDLERNTGLEGIGIVRVVPKEEREAHEAELRKAYPEYQLRPAVSDRPVYALTHLESLGPSPQNALGWDIYGDPVRREAMDRARDSGEPAVTARTRLFMADGSPGPVGFILYVPIFRHAAKNLTQEELRQNLLGYVFTSFNAPVLWKNLFRNESRPIDFEIYDGTDLTKENQFYDDDGQFFKELNYRPLFDGNLQADLFGRTWNFHFYTRPDPETAFERRLPVVLLSLGIVSSLLFFGFVFMQARARRTAEKLTQDLRASENAVRAANRELARKVTEAEEASEKLSASLSLQLATIESTADGLLVVDCAAKVVGLNQQFLKMWRLSPGTVQCGDAISALQPAADQTLQPSAFLAQIEEGCTSAEGETQDVLLLPDGRSIERHSQPQRSGAKTLGRVWSFRDVTDRKRAEEELIRASKVESIGLLAGGIAHDFNNVLTGIVGNLSLLREHPGLPKEVAERMALLEKSAYKARQLTHQLLTFAKGGSPIKQAASMAETVKEAAEFALRGSNVRAEFTFAANLAGVEIDAGQISQV
ncbi:MAG TPA: CHASE domain-containing protein, partial [Verrucomicrobiae bacterium]|nr:CHASE domain-containing protein [Verrucomicrobiae bacterium]